MEAAAATKEASTADASRDADVSGEEANGVTLDKVKAYIEGSEDGYSATDIVDHFVEGDDLRRNEVSAILRRLLEKGDVKLGRHLHLVAREVAR